MKFFIAVATLVVVVAAIFSSSPAAALEAVPKFELNLDLAPEDRWTGAVEAILAVHPWENSFAPVLDLYLPISYLVPANVKTALGQALKLHFPEQYGEMQGLWKQFVKYGHADKIATFEDYSVIAFAYELEHLNFMDLPNKKKIFYKKACTGILSLPSDPKLDILHGRNMDESPKAGRNLTLHITATKGGKTVWEALDWLWVSSGVETSSRQDGVTLELNYRPFFDRDDKKNFTFAEFTKIMLQPNAVPVLLFHRAVHDKMMDFEQTLEFATQKAAFAAPFYTVMSGTKRRGAVMTLRQDPSKTFVFLINDTYVSKETGGTNWFLVQTNYDLTKPDNMNDPRRTVAENTLKMLGRERGATELGVWMAESVFPVHNANTMYTALMSVGKPIEGYVRRSMEPWN